MIVMPFSSMENTQCRIILLGNAGIGKTSLVSSYIAGSYEPETFSTVAPASSIVNVTTNDGQTISLQVWDTAGQEKYQSLSTMFYREADIAFICFQKDGIESVRNWSQVLAKQRPNCKKFLVLTKSDLYSPEELADIQPSCFEMMSEVNAIQFVITSSRLGIGLNDLFELAANEALQMNAIKPTPIPEPISDNPGKSNCC